MLRSLFVDGHYIGLDEEDFLGCDGVIYAVEGDDVLLYISRREASPWLRCPPDATQRGICLGLEELNRSGYLAISPGQFDIARNDATTFRVSLGSLDLQSDRDNLYLNISLPGLPSGQLVLDERQRNASGWRIVRYHQMSDVQALFLNRILGGPEVMQAVYHRRGNDWKTVSISFPGKSKVMEDIGRARKHRAGIPAVGYGFGINVSTQHSAMHVTLVKSGLYQLPFSVIGMAWK